MPVSGNEETGVKPVTWQPSDNIAGVPIKKRKFHIRPPSPTPEEPSSLTAAENDSLPKEQSSPSQGSTLSKPSVATSSSGLSDANKNSVPEERKGNSDAKNVNLVQSNANLSKVKLEEPSLTHSGSLADIVSKEKLVAAKTSTSIFKDSAKTELTLAPIEALSLNVGKEINSSQKVEGQCKSERSTISGNTALSLGLKEHLVSALAGQNGEGSSRNQENVEPVLLSLSLSKEESITQCKSDNVGSNTDTGNLRAKRCNWDLNTTMDAWEGPVSDAGAGEATVGGLKTANDTHDIKPLIIPSGGIVGACGTSGKQIVEANFIKSFAPSGQPSNYEDSLHLGLSPSSFQSNFSQQPSSSSAKVDASGVIRNFSLPGAVIPNISLPGVVMPIGNLNMVNVRTVKSEPLDESVKHDSKGSGVIPMGLLDLMAVKHELFERSNLEARKSSNVRTMKLMDDPRSIKPEPFNEGNQETLKTIKGKSNHSDKQILQDVDARGVPTCSTVLSISGDVSKCLEPPVNTKGEHPNGEGPQKANGNARPVASEMISVGQDGNESNISGVIDTPTAEDKNVDAEHELLPDSRGTGEGSASDEEKISLSGDMLEEDSFGSDYESDGNHDLTTAMDTEQVGGVQDDFEDGEVREPQENTAVEGPICEKREVEHINHSDSDDKNTRLPGDDHPTSSHVEEDTKKEDPGETSNSFIKECMDTVHDEKTNKIADKDTCLQESSAVEMPMSEADKKQPVEAIQSKPLDTVGREDALKGQEMEPSADQATNGNPGTSVTTAQGSDENIKKTDVVEKNDSALLKAEASLTGDDTAKDVNSGGNRSRIINLSRASNVSSPGKTRSISGRSLPSRAGRERLPDVALDGDNIHPRGRDEIYSDSYQKFSRERHQDQSSRNSRLNLVRGRGRVSNRIDTLRGDWDTERDLPPEFYNGPTEFRVPRHKFASAVGDAGLEFNGYNIGHDGVFVGGGRGGRKLINEEAPMFRHLPSRRRSPGVRDGPTSRGLQMARRIPRNIGEEGSDLVGLRPNEKFMRGFPGDNTDPVFTRPQPQFEGLDGHFVRGNRNFSSVQRRGLPRIRSKSPIRSRTRSPGPRSSPRRRSPDGFGGPPELPHRRSPPVYRMERVRSPGHPCFPPDLVVRRHGSPSYMSRPTNDLRDLDSGWEHGHPRSVIPHRSPSGRVLLRNSRRFDIVDPRERTDGNEFFGGPMPSGRFHELGGDGNGEERRRFGERRGPVRPFRPPFNGADCENFHLNAEDGPRPFRFCPEDGTEFPERGNLRDREFDRRIKNRPGNLPRRTRTIEEQEGNFRPGGQVWHEDGFDDISRMKRKRF